LTQKIGRRLALDPSDTFPRRHIGPRESDLAEMLEVVGFRTLDELAGAVVPEAIRLKVPLRLDPPRGEHELAAALRALASENRVARSFIGMGYHDCITPPVIQRNVLENPGWYTPYTPYQAEIAQGRLEALLNFQTLVADLTALPVANASLLDEATAAAEAMAMCRAASRGAGRTFFVSAGCHPQAIGVVTARARPLGIRVEVGDPAACDLASGEIFGVLVQYPATDGRIADLSPLGAATRAAGVPLVVATDLLALTLLRPPGECGADIALGSSQRFGVPLGYGGPHAAFLATREDYRRLIPGRIVGVSRDAAGRSAYRLALQTREQHIRRDKATSNICTSQVLLAVVASMYGVYHGPAGLRRIAERVCGLTRLLAAGLSRLGYDPGSGPVFDTLRVSAPGRAERLLADGARRGMNLRPFPGADAVGISLDETTTQGDVEELLGVFAAAGAGAPAPALAELAEGVDASFEPPLARTSLYLTHDVFQRYHSEHEMLRYLHRLQSRDLSLAHSMIPLGSCTMKLNATTLMQPVTWPEFNRLHPFAPPEQAAGYRTLLRQLERWLGEITGLPAVSLQPNSGAQGEYAGLLVIRAYHASRGDERRDVCLIPSSAHGTNPASAVLAGLSVVVVQCREGGDVDLDDLRAKATAHRDRLAALMITYPSTHGVFEEQIQEVCRVVHDNGGQVYLDGANMNAQVGLCRPAEIGADVCHLNLHKTFCIPHGGGGPGMGPIAVREHLASFLPDHPVVPGVGGERSIGPVAAAPFGSPSILPISWSYIALMGEPGLKKASQVAILNANYMATRLAPHFRVLYRGRRGLVAHEFIIDARPFKDSAGVTVDDIAKRLMDFGFHAPTMSWPVAGTLMVEPTESESREELDRFCDAMIAIRAEIREIEEGRADREQNPLKGAPHTAEVLLDDAWERPYSRTRAAFPAPWVAARKFWPAVGRIDNAYGDRNLVCTCGPVEDSAS
jgi:glycine dehydrogenase